jgi:hypothetical protein
MLPSECVSRSTCGDLRLHTRWGSNVFSSPLACTTDGDVSVHMPSVSRLRRPARQSQQREGYVSPWSVSTHVAVSRSRAGPGERLLFGVFLGGAQCSGEGRESAAVAPRGRSCVRP